MSCKIIWYPWQSCSEWMPPSWALMVEMVRMNWFRFWEPHHIPERQDENKGTHCEVPLCRPWIKVSFGFPEWGPSFLKLNRHWTFSDDICILSVWPENRFNMTPNIANTSIWTCFNVDEQSILTNTQNNTLERNQKLLRSRIDQSTQIYPQSRGPRKHLYKALRVLGAHPLMSDGIVHELNNGHVTAKTIELVWSHWCSVLSLQCPPASCCSTRWWEYNKDISNTRTRCTEIGPTRLRRCWPGTTFCFKPRCCCCTRRRRCTCDSYGDNIWDMATTHFDMAPVVSRPARR